MYCINMSFRLYVLLCVAPLVCSDMMLLWFSCHLLALVMQQWVCMYMYMYVCICICVYVCIYACVYHLPYLTTTLLLSYD